MPTPISPATLAANVAAPTNRIEFTGVRYFAWKRVNQGGSSPSHPATIGSRVLPANITLDCATRMMSSARMVMGAMIAAAPSGWKPRLNTCGIGAMRSIWSNGTSASTELVPRMNITTMIGAAIATDRPIARTGLRHSPA